MPPILLLAALLATGVPSPGAAPAAPGAGPCAIAKLEVGGPSSFPPCSEVVLEADASGRPPLAFLWTLPDGSSLVGNPALLDTGTLDDGFQEIVLDVSNADGSARVPIGITIESLGFAGAPVLTPLANGVVAVLANTSGATEWRWTWGDGTTSGWLSGCPGYSPSHDYPRPGIYVVTVQARSCRGGPVVWTGVLLVQNGNDLFSNGFETGDLSGWLVH